MSKALHTKKGEWGTTSQSSEIDLDQFSVQQRTTHHHEDSEAHGRTTNLVFDGVQALVDVVVERVEGLVGDVRAQLKRVPVCFDIYRSQTQTHSRCERQ